MSACQRRKRCVPVKGVSCVPFKSSSNQSTLDGYHLLVGACSHQLVLFSFVDPSW